jgi:hypothetical protein
VFSMVRPLPINGLAGKVVRGAEVWARPLIRRA